jgi:hypothetical protein
LAGKYNAPLGIIGNYLGVGRSAVSAMLEAGKETVRKRRIDI